MYNVLKTMICSMLVFHSKNSQVRNQSIGKANLQRCGLNESEEMNELNKTLCKCERSQYVNE